MSDPPILETRNLKKYFKSRTSIIDRLLGDEQLVHAVDDVSLELNRNDSKAVIGESGCGKSTLLKTLVGLHKPTGGELLFKGRDVSTFGKAEWKEFRRNIQIIFQDPFNSFDPKLTVKESLREPLKIHNMDDHEERLLKVLKDVELQPPERFLTRRPRQLSGGERQRVAIARALMVEPDLILADEPVSMLDVSTQSSILKLLSNLVNDFDTSLLYISHDLSTVSYVCDEISVMYRGRVIEHGPTRELIQSPKHPYTQALIGAVSIPDPHHERERTNLEGAVQAPINLEDSCRFKDRCPERMDICEVTPDLVDVDQDRTVACHLYYDHELDNQESPNRYDGENLTEVNK